MPELDAVRGVAVLMVVIYHGFFWSHPLSHATGFTRLLLKATQPGWLGVELFFVLSGFLITGILVDARARPQYFRPFYVRRARRILPPYLVLLAMLLVSGVVGLPFATLALCFLANVAPLFGVPMQYGPLWSLAVEEHFYLAWPLAVRVLEPRRLAAVAWGVVLGLPLVRLLAWTRGEEGGLFLYTWFTVDGLAMGALLALYLRRPAATRVAVARLGGACVAASAALFAIGAPFGILTRSAALGAALQYTPWCLGFTGALTLSLVIGTGPHRRWVQGRVLRFFGDISYGLYLVHLLCFIAYDAALTRWVAGVSPADVRLGPMLARFVVAAGAATLLATLSRRSYEAWFLARQDRGVFPPDAAA